MRCVVRVTLATLLLGVCSLLGPGNLRSADSPASSADKAKVELKDITYTDLGKVVKANRGKVVVVDMWSVY